MIEKLLSERKLDGEIAKTTGLFLLSAAAALFFLLRFILVPIHRIAGYREQGRTFDLKIKSLRSELERIEEIYNKRSDENEKNKETWENLRDQSRKLSFIHAGAFAAFIEETAVSHNIRILSAGALEERDSGEDSEARKKYACSYEFLGSMGRLKQFLHSLEEAPWFLSLNGTPLTFEIENDMAKLFFKVSFYLDENVHKEEKVEPASRKIPLNRLLGNIKNYDVINLNHRNYIVLTFSNNRKKTYLEDETMIIDQKTYKIKTDGDRAFLEQ